MKLWLDDVRPAPEGWVHVRTVADAKEKLQECEVEIASLDHDLGYTGPLPGPCSSCNRTGVFEGFTCPDCDGDGYIGGDILYRADHAEEDGIELVKWLVEQKEMENKDYCPPKVLIHSWNTVGRVSMYHLLQRYFPDKDIVIQPYVVSEREGSKYDH